MPSASSSLASYSPVENLPWCLFSFSVSLWLTLSVRLSVCLSGVRGFHRFSSNATANRSGTPVTNKTYTKQTKRHKSLQPREKVDPTTWNYVVQRQHKRTDNIDFFFSFEFFFFICVIGFILFVSSFCAAIVASRVTWWRGGPTASCRAPAWTLPPYWRRTRMVLRKSVRRLRPPAALGPFLTTRCRPCRPCPPLGTRWWMERR